MFKNVNGVDVEMAPNEIVARQAEEAAWAASADVRAAESVRKSRNALLVATDYMGLADYPVKAGELEYRQALRDVPQQAGFPKTHAWPNKPNGIE